MSTSSIVLTESNLSSSGTFDPSSQSAPYNRLSFNLGSASLAGKKIALQKASLYYSWPNITSSNNSFSFDWPTSTSTYTTFSVSIPPRTNYSSIDQLNDFLKTALIQNGCYIINSTSGDFLYYMSFVANPNSYGVSLVLTQVPTALPGGYSQPGNFPGWPTTARCMRFTTNTSDFSKLIGFTKSTTYGSVSSAVVNSTFCPQLSPVSSVMMTCNLANNKLALNNDSTIIYSFTTRDTVYGSMLTVEPNNIVFYDIASNSNVLTITFVDQDGQALWIQDPQISVLLLISEA